MSLLVSFSFERMLGSLIRKVQLVLQKLRQPVRGDVDACLQPHVLGQPSRRPHVEGVAQFSRRAHHHLAQELEIVRVRFGFGPRVKSVVQPVNALFQVAFAPLGDGSSLQARGPGDLRHGLPVGRHQHHRGAMYQTAVPCPTPQLLQLPSGSRWHVETDCCRHDPLSLVIPAAKYSSSWFQVMLTFQLGLT